MTIIYIGSNLFINLPPMQQSNLLNLYLNYLPIPLSKIIWSNPLNLSRLLFCTCLFVGNMRTNGSSFFLFRSYRNTSSLAAPRQASSNNAASEATHLIAQHPPPRPALSNYSSVAAAITSREQTFDPRPKWSLVPKFFAPGTRDTFSPGWWLQPGLKVPAQRLLRQIEVAGTFSPG